MKQFGRRWKLDISNDQETLTIEQLRVAFEIDKTINEKPNPAKIQVWNLNRDHINQLLSQDYKKVALSVGYGELRREILPRQESNEKDWILFLRLSVQMDIKPILSREPKQH